MEPVKFKDDRSKDKRAKMKQYRKVPPPPLSQRINRSSNETSSSYQMEAIRGVIDVADSSDDRFTGHTRPPTRFINQMPVRELEVLDLNDEQSGEENPQLNAGDFNVMSQMPASVGGHFQFSSEKNWDSDDKLLNTEASEYFTLNLKLLNVGLQSIPFYKRLDYPTSMFSRDQLLAMDQAAEAYEKHYQKVLKDHQSNPKIKIGSGKRTPSAKSQLSSKLETKAEQDDELDELLSMTAAVNSSAIGELSEVGAVENNDQATSAADPSDASGNIEGGNKEDIQQWLDNVLDE